MERLVNAPKGKGWIFGGIMNRRILKGVCVSLVVRGKR